MPGPARDDAHIHLICFDFDGAHGWEFRIPKWFPRTLPGQFYSRAKYGSMEVAYQAAKSARDQLFEDEGLPLHLGWHPYNERNTSGVTGVCLAVSGRKHGNPLTALRWQAYWSDQGHHVRRSFGVVKHGFEAALMLAVEFRRQKTKLALTPEELAALRDAGRRVVAQHIPESSACQLLQLSPPEVQAYKKKNTARGGV